MFLKSHLRFFIKLKLFDSDHVIYENFKQMQSTRSQVKLYVRGQKFILVIFRGRVEVLYDTKNVEIDQGDKKLQLFKIDQNSY